MQACAASETSCWQSGQMMRDMLAWLFPVKVLAWTFCRVHATPAGAGPTATASGQTRSAVVARRRPKPVNWLPYIKKGDLSRCSRRSTGAKRASPDGGEKQASGRSHEGEPAVVYGDFGRV